MTQAANVKYANAGNMHSAPAYYLSLSLSPSLSFSAAKHHNTRSSSGTAAAVVRYRLIVAHYDMGSSDE